MANRFSRYQLRTTDVDSAVTFYGQLFGADFWGRGIEVVPLPSALIARGVPPYWLGHVGVDDVVATMDRLLAAGATRLAAVAPDGGDAAGVVLRDPFGAMLALAPATVVTDRDRVAWHLLTTRDDVRASEVYADALGWALLEAYDLGPERGRHVAFSCDGSQRAVGSISDVARRPHVHPQWLYFFPTADLDASLHTVRDLDGLALPATATADGHRVAVCDDPQGAAFALYETSRP
jgi:uncharacterized protein